MPFIQFFMIIFLFVYIQKCKVMFFKVVIVSILS